MSGKISVGKVGGIEAMLHSPGKMNTSMPEVRRGAGVWKNRRAYDRKTQNANIKNEIY